MEQIKKSLSFYNLWEDDLEGRIRPIVGDASLPYFGLPEEEFQTIGKTLRTIIHCASWVNIIFDYSTLKPSNVISTLEALRLANQSEVLVNFHYVSTLSTVFGAVGKVAHQHTEEEEYKLASAGRGGYALSKWIAERLVIQCHRKGLPTVIYQPGTIGGSSIDGSFNVNDYVFKILACMIEMKKVPIVSSELSLNITPVDKVSNYIVQMVKKINSDANLLSASLDSITLPILNPSNLLWKDVLHWIVSHSKTKNDANAVESIPYSDWAHQLGNSINKVKPSQLMISMEPFLPQLKLHIPSFGISESNVSKLISQTTLHFPHFCKRIERELVYKYLDQIIRISSLDKTQGLFIMF
eukprot:TRINITY_DN7346_c0_g1_i1.p1 TRINITY_DN7346_c0_g1~~TRINITY_DN7346_c0_g1_i1.p1  ORF type:complete len:354 (-),score=77.46 TRINITY_DN7346_c0_g1_i1:285-1346(-)